MTGPITQAELQAMYDNACLFYPDSYDAYQGYVQALCDIANRLGFVIDRQAEYEGARKAKPVPIVGRFLKLKG